MYGKLPEKLKFTDNHKQILQNTVINETSPGTILHDFKAVIDFFRERKQKLTPAHQLTLNTVREINQHLQQPIQVALKRPVQKSYPPVYGLYLLVRASGLTTVDTSSKQPVLMVDETAYAQWLSLNETERYFSLLEAWLLRGYGEIIGERSPLMGDSPDNFDSMMRFAGFYDLDDGLFIAGKRELWEGLKYTPGLHNLGLMYLFGLITVQAKAPRPNEGWNIERITLTPFGAAVLALLYTELSKQWTQFFAGEDADDSSADSLQLIFQPYIPAWEKSFILPETPFVEGVHVFKVSWGSVWRRIAINANETLDTLAQAILDSVNFDNDHLYEFSYRSRVGKVERIAHPFTEEPPFTSEVQVGGLGLWVGQPMTFLFDYGDNWEFEVLLEEVEADRQVQPSELRASQGEAPEQYPNEDDDWEVFIVDDDDDGDE